MSQANCDRREQREELRSELVEFVCENVDRGAAGE